MEPSVRIEYKLNHPLAKLPTRAYESDAGSDLYSIEHLVIMPGETRNVDTGLIYVVPNGYYITINGRSSLNKRGLIAFRGVVDAGYQGNLMVSITNTGQTSYIVQPGDRVAQITVHRRLEQEAVEVLEFSPKYSMRGTNGFGSSGR